MIIGKMIAPIVASPTMNYSEQTAMAKNKTDISINKISKSTRRGFLVKSVAASLFSFTIVPRHVLGGPGQTPPSERINIAGIGCGGMGGGDIATFTKLGANYIALCDVDEIRAAVTFNAHPKARRYKDFREMLDKEAKNIDAVSVGTPDHTHAVAAMAAIKAGKHVYVQKPLTHTLYECRELTKAARVAKVVTSMGNQGHASEGSRLTNEWIQAGIIGDVREVHVWSDRAGTLWKQGIGRPTEQPPIPSTLDWNLWLGPIADRPYHPGYVPAGWRGWWDFGTGALGDMGCHIIDHPVWALNLGAPTSVEATTTHDGTLLAANKLNFETYPIAAVVTFQFPAREGGKLPPVTMTWYDGGLMPPTPVEMSPEQKLPGNGVLYVGSKGKMFHSSHGGMPQLLPASLHEHARLVTKTMERSPGHYEEWYQACRGGKLPVANFDYAGPMTETVLLGVLSMRSPGNRLLWDAANLKVTNNSEVNQYIHTEYRTGWSL
jgi:predicted dehydrogenase